MKTIAGHYLNSVWDFPLEEIKEHKIFDRLSTNISYPELGLMSGEEYRLEFSGDEPYTTGWRTGDYTVDPIIWNLNHLSQETLDNMVIFSSKEKQLSPL